MLSDAIWAAYRQGATCSIYLPICHFISLYLCKKLLLPDSCVRRSLEIGGKDSNLGPGRSVNRASIANIDVISNAVEASQMLADRVTVDAEAEDVPVSR